MTRSCVALVVLALVGPPFATAAADAYLVDMWGVERGLPGGSATALAQTPEGYLWVGTYDGLARFNGDAFTVFDPANTPALRHARIERLFVDDDGALWINTHDGSLTSWRHGVFSLEWRGKSRTETGVWLGLSNQVEQVFLLQTGVAIRRALHGGRPGPWRTIQAENTRFNPPYFAAAAGALWIRSDDGRLYKVVGGRCARIPTSPGLVGRQIQCLSADRDGRLWVGTERELARWTGAGFERMTPENGASSIDVTSLFFTRAGAFWAVANQRLLKGRGRRWLAEAPSVRRMVTAAWPNLIAREDGRGAVWLAHDGRGLTRVASDGSSRRFGLTDKLASERVKCLLVDREGNVWCGVDRGGLVRVRERRFQLLSDVVRTPAYAAVSVCEDGEGAVWFGTLGGGIFRWSEGELTRFGLPRPATRQFVFSIFPGDDGRLWLSADFENLWILGRGGARRAPWPVHGIKVILVDRSRRIWMGKKDGLSCWTGKTIRHFGRADGIEEIDVRALAQDHEGAIWIGCGDGTLYRFRGKAFERVPTGEAQAGHPVWSLHAQQDGTVWAGTYGGGLLRLKDERVIRFTKDDGLLSNVVCQLVDDEQGHLWVGSREGLLRFSKESIDEMADGTRKRVSSLRFGRSDALPPLECSGYQPSSWRGRDGRLWFATVKGLISVQPRELTENRVPPPVVIEDVRVDRQPQNLAGLMFRPAADVVGETSTVQPVLVIPPGRHHLELRFAGLSLTAPEQVRFRYQLEGLERGWIDAGGNRTAQYSYLRPGQYRFRVVACNSDGVWNEQGATLALRVLPHIWETWWFLSLLAILALAAAVGTTRHVAMRRLRREMAHLERQRAVERDRARIARDIHDDLGAGLTRISLLSELARSDRARDAKTHLERISESAAELTRAMDEIVWAVNPTNDTLDGLWSYLSQFAEEYLATGGLQCRLHVPDDLPPLPLSAEARHNVFLCFKEALNNVLKHAEAREVVLRLELQREALVLVIQDDGKGFDPSAPSGRPCDGRTTTGHGLRNMIRRMSAIGGVCVIHSQPGHGARIVLTVARH